MSWAVNGARIVVAAALFVGPVSQSPAAEPYIQEELRIPFAPAGPRGLEALLVRPNEAGRYPLALIEHGSPRSLDEQRKMSPWSMLPQAIEFARRGWAAVVVMRRGYGDSGGEWAEGYGSCASPNYFAAGTASAADLKAAITFLVTRPDIDPSRVISVGVSAGGFATVALTADPPASLVAAISFAGGRGSQSSDEVCRADRLIEAFRVFGRRSQTPMLWVYAENDHFFGPELAEQLKAAFTGSGGNVEFVTAPAFGSDGHRLFSLAGIPVWTPLVDAFLQRHGLRLQATPLPPPPRPALTAPRNLSNSGRSAFETYLTSPPHKAFALSPGGHYGWQTGQRTTEAARSGALKYCEENAVSCDVVFVDDVSVAKK